MHYSPRGGGGEVLRTITFWISCAKSNSNRFYSSPRMRNQVETQKERSQLTSVQKNSIHYLPGGCLRTMTLRISCVKSNYVRFYWSPGMQNQVETQKERCQLNSDQKDSMHYLPREGGGGLRNMNLRMRCSKSNSNTFCGSPEMRNQVEHKRNGPKWRQFSKILCIICDSNDFKNELLQIQF